MTHDFEAAYAALFDEDGEIFNQPETLDVLLNKKKEVQKALRIMMLVQEGTHKIAPVEPTQGYPSMAQAGAAKMWDECKKGLIGHDQACAVYKAMLADAPDVAGEEGAE